MSVVKPDYVQHVLDHYRREAERRGTSPASTMWDDTTREREVQAITALLKHLGRGDPSSLEILEVGCGNGVLLAHLSAFVPGICAAALEFSPDMARLARGRELRGIEIIEGDVRKMPFDTGRFDVVIGERCIINLMDRAHQSEALSEIARVLRPGGHYICIEAFTDGLSEMNTARDELGLAPIPQAHHNLWFDKEWFLESLVGQFLVIDLAAHAELPQTNFLSTHYFVSRVLYPSVSRREPLYNTLFVKFFSFLPPYGNFSPIQLFLLQRRH